ncbi:CAP domain-containing protein [Pyronema domesticum]|nr:CAP domain-containing protein [Pyronema domesticum]
MKFSTLALSTLAIATVTLADLRSDYLKPHNQARREHQVGNLQWDNGLAASSQRHANRCVYQHSPGVGENLAWGNSLGRGKAVQLWVDERRYFNFQNGGFSAQTGHFTQVVWKGTTRIGCAERRCGGVTMHVCQYSAPGNYQGQYRQNVFPRRFSKARDEESNDAVAGPALESKEVKEVNDEEFSEEEINGSI